MQRRELDDARVGDAALVDLALPALEGRVAGHGPAPRIVVVAERPADLVDAPVHLVHADALEVREPALVDGALLASLGAGAVVGDHEHHRVVRVAEIVDETQHPADLLVGVGEEGGEALHEPLGELPLALVETVPAGHPRRPRRKHGLCGNDAERELAGERLVAPAVPAPGEVAAVALDPFGRGVMRRVTGARCEVEEERQLVVDRPEVAQVLDGAIGQVGAQVIAVLGGPRGSHDVVVVVEARHELVGLAAVEAVPAIEPPAERPGGTRARHVRLVLGTQMPFAHGVGGVAAGPKDLGEEPVLTRRPAPVTGKAHGEIGDPSHAAAVMVAPGQQTGPGGRAERGGVKVGEPDALRGDAVDDGGRDVRAVAAQLREAHVVEDDQHHVRRTLRWGGYRRPPRLGIRPVVADLPPEFDAGHRVPPRGPSSSRRPVVLARPPYRLHRAPDGVLTRDSGTGGSVGVRFDRGGSAMSRTYANVDASADPAQAN